jgi:hypothetical protein
MCEELLERDCHVEPTSRPGTRAPWRIVVFMSSSFLEVGGEGDLDFGCSYLNASDLYHGQRKIKGKLLVSDSDQARTTKQQCRFSKVQQFQFYSPTGIILPRGRGNWRGAAIPPSVCTTS